MDRLHARVGIWTTRFAPAITVLRTLVQIAGYANLHTAVPAITQIALR